MELCIYTSRLCVGQGLIPVPDASDTGAVPMRRKGCTRKFP